MKREAQRDRTSVGLFFYPGTHTGRKVGRTASEEIVIEIVNRKCLPVLLYGLEACPLSVADMKSLDFVVTRFLMKLFKTSSMSIINECLPTFGIILPSQIIQRRAARFKSNFHFINVYNT